MKSYSELPMHTWGPCKGWPDPTATHGAPPAVWLDLRYAQEAPLAPPLVIVFIHGGGFCSHTATEHLFAAGVLPRLARRGVAARVLALDYDYHHPDRERQVLACLHAWR